MKEKACAGENQRAFKKGTEVVHASSATQNILCHLTCCKQNYDANMRSLPNLVAADFPNIADSNHNDLPANTIQTLTCSSEQFMCKHIITFHSLKG
jgi:hypothetical protein